MFVVVIVVFLHFSRRKPPASTSKTLRHREVSLIRVLSYVSVCQTAVPFVRPVTHRFGLIPFTSVSLPLDGTNSSFKGKRNVVFYYPPPSVLNGQRVYEGEIEIHFVNCVSLFGPCVYRDHCDSDPVCGFRHPHVSYSLRKRHRLPVLPFRLSFFNFHLYLNHDATS